MLALTAESIKTEKIRIWKNVIVLSVGFLLLFMSFSSIGALQSSINSDQGLGTYSLTVIYVGLVFSSLFLVTFTIDKLTPKWTIVVSDLCYLGYILAQFHPAFYTLLPTGLLVGLAAAPLWSAKCTYISVAGKRYSQLCQLQKANSGASGADGSTGDVTVNNKKLVNGGEVDVNQSSTIMLFFGVFFATFQSAGIWGNLITSSVLSSGEAQAAHLNSSDISLCGKNFCEDVVKEVSNLQRPEEWKINLISGIFVCIAFSSAVLIGVLLDPLSNFENNDGEEEKLSGMKLVMSTMKQMLEPRQALIISLVFFGGLEQGFFEADFTKGFVGCTWGIQKIGYVLMAAKATNSFGSIFLGKLVKYTGRVPVFLTGYVLHVSGIIYLLTWEPNSDTMYALFVMVVLWMLADSVWQTQINGLHGILFHDNVEAAFSVYKVWESLGFIVAFFTSPLLCMNVKLYSLLSILTFGFVCYCALEVLLKKRSKAGNSDKS